MRKRVPRLVPLHEVRRLQEGRGAIRPLLLVQLAHGAGRETVSSVRWGLEGRDWSDPRDRMEVRPVRRELSAHASSGR
jgi:hypothetical protein